MASSKDIYEAKIFASDIYAAGIFRGLGATVAIPEADQFYAVRGVTGLSVAVRGVTGLSVAARGVTGLSVPVKGDQ